MKLQNQVIGKRLIKITARSAPKEPQTESNQIRLALITIGSRSVLELPSIQLAQRIGQVF